MDTPLSRLSAISFFSVTVILVLGGLSSLSSFLHTPRPIVKKLELSSLTKLVPHNGQDWATFSFDIDADLRDVWTWNTKQLFVFVTAEYTTDSHKLNQFVIWDKIVTSKESSVFKGSRLPIEYPLVDRYNELRNTEIKLRLSWDVQPIIGMLQLNHDETNLAEFSMPTTYKR